MDMEKELGFDEARLYWRYFIFVRIIWPPVGLI